MAATQTEDTKLRSPDLIEAIRADRPDRMTVIVEIRGGQPELELSRDALRSNLRLLAVSSPGIPSDETVQDVSTRIAEITKKVPKYLRHGGAFIVDASGGEIARIARISEVSAIWLNRNNQGERDVRR